MVSILKWAAIATALFVVAATVYEYIYEGGSDAELKYRLGNLRLEDQLYDEALAEFDALLSIDPNHAEGHLGRALALMDLGDAEGALQAFAAALQIRPEFGAAYANRGILMDRLGRHENALRNYHRALTLDSELGEGPDWLTRFFRNQYDRPPTIADRARYLERELKKPLLERVLKVPEADASQRAYKYEGE